MKKYLLSVLCSIVSINVWAGNTPIFLVTPNLTGQTQLNVGQQGSAIFQITNNSNRSLSNIGLVGLPGGVSNVANAGYQYCTFPLNMTPNSYCLIKLSIDSNQISGVLGGPKVCFSASRPVYCSQPLQTDQLSTQILSSPVPQTCPENSANFNSELAQVFDSTVIDPGTINSWGPARNQLLMSTANPNLLTCTTTSIANTTSVSWMQSRIIAAENLWVNQKLNYCHHHVVDFATPAISNGIPRTTIGGSDGGFCSNATDIMPGSVYYGQAVRWNYTGTGSETNANWNNNQYMWYGVDCSDFTSFVYNFAFGIQFNSDTGFQAGQATDGSQPLLTPNGQDSTHVLQAFRNGSSTSPAGVLLCKNGQTEQENPQCGGYGTNGYMSSFLNKDFAHGSVANLTPAMLYLLHPGDLLFLAFPPGDSRGDGNNPNSVVTHVITWTGKQVGFGPNDVNPSQIAPESICPQADWQPQVGDWVIIDSHYQGPDYRVFSQCFYQNNIYGVRRVIGYMQPNFTAV
jgi:cell wall-associated NlpC family hydrolase